MACGAGRSSVPVISSPYLSLHSLHSLHSLPPFLNWEFASMAKFWPVFFFLLFYLSFGEIAASNGNGESEVVNVVKVAKQSIQTRGAINEFEKEEASKQAEMKRGIVVNLTLNEIGEIVKFLGETFLHDYILVLRHADYEKFYLLDNLKKLIEENVKESQQKHPSEFNSESISAEGIRSTTSVLSDEKVAQAKLVNNLLPSLLSSPTIHEFCSKYNDLQCAAVQTESLYKFGAFLMQNLLNFCRRKSNTIKCREWWHLFRVKLKDSVACKNWSIVAKMPNPEQMHYYMTYIQYIRRWRNKMNKYTIPLTDILKKEKKVKILIGKKVKKPKKMKIAEKMNLGKLVDEVMKEPKFRIVYDIAKKEINSPLWKLSKKQESQLGSDKDITKKGRRRRPVIARLYYWFSDRETGEGNNHGGVLLDDTEFHFFDNGGIEIFLKDGYTTEEHDADLMFDYEVGFTSKTQLEIQSILDKLAEGKFGPGKYTSEKGNQTASNNCVTFLKDFILLILDRPPAKWPYPLSKAFYGTFKQFSDEMARYLTNWWLQWEKPSLEWRPRTASRVPNMNTSILQ